MKKITIVAAIVVILFSGLFLMQHYLLKEHETTSVISASFDEKQKSEEKKKPEPKKKEEAVEQLKTFEGDEYTDPAGKIGVIDTNKGTIKVKFFPEAAPNTVQSFIYLANKGFYDGLTFHRIIEGFVIQGGCPKGDGTGGPGYRIKAEFNDIEHDLGILSMARSQDPDSAGSQFFICLDRLPHLDENYTVFGEVIDGIEVVRKIGSIDTDMRDRPLREVVIESIKIVDQKKE